MEGTMGDEMPCGGLKEIYNMILCNCWKILFEEKVHFQTLKIRNEYHQFFVKIRETHHAKFVFYKIAVPEYLF